MGVEGLGGSQERLEGLREITGYEEVLEGVLGGIKGIPKVKKLLFTIKP